MSFDDLLPGGVPDGDGSAIRRYTFRRDHRSLLPNRVIVTPDIEPRDSSVDAVIVPNHRHPHRLGAAVDLAADLDSDLVVMCTKDHEREVVRTLRSRPRQLRRGLVIALGWPASMPLGEIATMDEFGARADKYRDVAAKRNIGLALARQQGWERVVFVDDDVRNLSSAHVEAAAACLAPGTSTRAGSWLLARYPDNSVVCHARRLAGLPQGIFPGGGALIVRVAEPLPMFPPVYNEDWLFLFDLLKAGAVSYSGRVRQMQFNPFAFPQRAQEEEFGDLLAEGMFHLLHEEVHDPATTGESFWRDVVRVRRLEIKRVLLRLNARSGPRQDATAAQRRVIAQACRALAAATRAHETHDLAPHLSSFVRAWRSDLEVWHEWFAKLEQVDTIHQALEPLGIERPQLTVV